MKNRNVPKLRFKEFSDEWEEHTIGEVCRLSSGSTPSKAKKENWNGKYRWVTSGELKSKFIYDTIDKVSEQGKKESNLREYEKGTFVIAIYGLEAQGTRGSSAILGEKATISQACMALEPIKDLKSEFLYSWYQKYGEMIGIRYAQGTKQQNLSTDLVGNLRIILPNREEQEKIANFLTKIDKIVEKQEEKVSSLEKYKKGMMQKIFSQEIRFKKDDGREYPEWNKKQLGEIGYFKTSSVDKLINEDEKSVKLVNYMDVYKHIELNNNTNLSIVTAKDNQIMENNLIKGDILFTPSSETPEDIGHSSVIFEDLNNTVYSYHLIRFRPQIKINTLYSHYFCNVDKVRNQIVKYATGSTRFTVSLKSFEKIVVELPCLEEQSKIAKFLSKIDSIVEKEKEKLEELRVWKKGLLQQMFV